MPLTPTSIFGTATVITDSPPSNPGANTTGTAFFTGFAERGPAGTAVMVYSITDFINKLGSRAGAYTPTLYDAVDVFFREGGSLAYVSRVPGVASVTATKNLLDSGAFTALVVTANGAGTWGNSLKVQVTAGVISGYRILVYRTIGGTDILQETSPDLTTQADAVNWGFSASMVRVALGAGSLVPVVAAAASLTTGTSDESNATETQWTGALTAFYKELGAGQVAAPGRTTTVAYTNLLTHASVNNRVAILDGADTGTVATLTTAAATLTALAGGLPRYGALFAPWGQYPGVISGTTRNVPPSAVVCGLIASSETAGNTPNRAPAGANGISNYMISLNNGVGTSGAQWTSTDINTLDNVGVNSFKTVGGRPRLYGFRSLVNPAGADQKYLQLGGQRLLMAITQDCNAVMENFVFGEVDGQGHLLSDFKGALQGVCKKYFDAGSLFGTVASQAFAVDVSAAVNSLVSLANGTVFANIVVRESVTGEYFQVNLSKVAITEALA